jgi:endonuclease/exonuclease/phosphatase family metal-dependent hydrolase
VPAEDGRWNRPYQMRDDRAAGVPMNMTWFRRVAVVVLAWSLAGLAWAQTSQPAIPATQPGDIKVMTSNIRNSGAKDGANAWPLRRELYVATIRRFAPDLLGTQEVLPDQAGYLKEQLKDYAFVGVGRDDGKGKGEHSAIFVRSARFEVLDSGTFWLSLTPDKPGSKDWDAAITRIVTWAKLRDKQAPAPAVGTLLYLNTHWDHIGKQARLESAKLMRRKTVELAKDLPVVITGDFNTTEDTPPYPIMLQGEGDAGDGAAKLIDAYRQANPQRLPDERTIHDFKGKSAGLRIDWILHTSQWTCVTATIDRTHKDEVFPSDHCPVWAVLRVEKR